MGPIVQALLATLFTYALTAVGASLVFCVDTYGNEQQTNAVMAVAAGMMLAAVNELLTSMAEESAGLGMLSWLPLAVGFLIACGMLVGMDRCLQQSADGAAAVASGSAPSADGHYELAVSGTYMQLLPFSQLFA